MATLRTEVLRQDNWAQLLATEWEGLFADSLTATPFQSPAWVTTWWEVYGKRRKPWIITVRDGDQLVALFPLMLRQGAWRTLRPIGIRGSDYLQPLIRTGWEAPASAEIARCLLDAKGIDIVDLHQIRETNELALIGALVADQANCLVLNLPKTYDEYLAGLSKSLRFDCRRLEKKPFTTGEATLQQVDVNNVDQAIETFFELHAQRWRRRGLPGAFALGSIQRFHRLVAPRMAAAGHLRMQLLQFEGKAVGVLYAMHAGRTTYFYQCGFDPDQKALSPGTLLVAAAIRDAISEGDQTFDFLRGDEPYKRRWKPQQEFRNQRHLLALNPLRGQLGKTFNDASGRFEAKIRARLEGKSLLS